MESLEWRVLRGRGKRLASWRTAWGFRRKDVGKTKNIKDNKNNNIKNKNVNSNDKKKLDKTNNNNEQKEDINLLIAQYNEELESKNQQAQINNNYNNIQPVIGQINQAQFLPNQNPNIQQIGNNVILPQIQNLNPNINQNLIQNINPNLLQNINPNLIQNINPNLIQNMNQNINPNLIQNMNY